MLIVSALLAFSSEQHLLDGFKEVHDVTVKS